MENINVLVLDDQPVPAQASIEAIAQFVPRERIIYAATAAQAMKILGEGAVSLAFLDIDMPDTSGFSVAEYMETHMPSVRYVFLTGYANFAARSYDYEPLDFLTKPIDLMRLAKTFDRLKAQDRPRRIEKLAMQTDQGVKLLSGEDIRFVERTGRKVWLYCLNNARYIVPHTLEELEVILSEYDFFRCHQSYLVPLRQIATLRSSTIGYTHEVVLSCGDSVPVSRAKFPQIKELLSHKGVRFV